MAILAKGNDFADGDDVTSTKLDNLVDAATFVSGSSGTTDDSSLEVNGSGRLQVKDGGITTGKLGASAVTTSKISSATGTTDGVTFAKIRQLEDMKVIGNVSGGTAAPTQVSILDEDDMSSDSATSLATQQSTKAYVDSGAWGGTYTGGETLTLPNGMIMKVGVATGVTSRTDLVITFAEAFPNAVVNFQTTSTNASGTSGSNYEYYYQVKSTSASAVTLFHQNVSASSSAANDVHWMAIGY